jgi:uncharacterized protein (DUF58 family)
MLGIFFILLIMWVLGMISSYTFGGAIHLLLVFAFIVLIIRLAQGRRAWPDKQTIPPTNA